MKTRYFFILNILSFIGYAQSKMNYDQMVAKYPDKSIIETIVQKKIEILLENNKPKVIVKTYEESILLKDDALGYGTESLFSSSFIKIKNIEAKTLVPKGNGYKTTINDNVEVKSDNSASSFYDDQKKHIVNFANIEKGAIRQLSYQTIYEEAHFFGTEFLNDYIPIEKLEIEIKCPKTFDLEIKFFNADDSKSKLTMRDEGKFKIYKISLQDIEPYKHFNGSPGYKWYLPHVAFYIKSYNNGKEQVDYMSNAKTLYNWYSGLIKHLPPITNEALKHITDSIANNSLSEKEKVKNIFYWVQKNIKYIAFEDGLGGFVPRDASLVFQKKYGDCKDMAFLIYSMLKYKNIDGYLTWIGSRDLPYSYDDLPTPLTDNHMIACYKEKNGKYIFLDATDKQVKFGSPTAFTQGKQALIGTTEVFIDTVFVPIVPATVNIMLDSTFLNIENNVVTGKCKNYFYGYNRIDYIERVSSLSKQKKEEFIKQEYQKGSNKFFVENINENINFNDTCAKFSFDFTIKDYLKKLNDELFINLNIEKNTDLYFLEKTFTTPYAISHKQTYKYVKVVNIPDNYYVTSMPNNYTRNDKNYQLKITYQNNQKQIINTVEIIFDTMLIPISEIPNWNSFVKEYQNQTKQIIVLKNK